MDFSHPRLQGYAEAPDFPTSSRQPFVPVPFGGERTVQALDDLWDVDEVEDDIATQVFGHFASVWEATLDRFWIDDAD
jgi:hypothetical protein